MRLDSGGYVAVYQPDHPRSSHQYVREHILKVERAIGKFLRRGAEVHHVNESKSDNRNENLVACHDHAYHMLLQRRQRAFRACGRADWRRCWICRDWSPPPEIVVRSPGGAYHLRCQVVANRVGRARRRLASSSERSVCDAVS